MEINTYLHVLLRIVREGELERRVLGPQAAAVEGQLAIEVPEAGGGRGGLVGVDGEHAPAPGRQPLRYAVSAQAAPSTI